VHRDLKSQNVLLNMASSELRAKVADFGTVQGGKLTEPDSGYTAQWLAVGLPQSPTHVLSFSQATLYARSQRWIKSESICVVIGSPRSVQTW
jgi:serine/threonine protein kinase